MQDDNIYRPPRGRGGRGGHQRQGDVPPDPPSRLSRNGPGEDGGGRDGGGRGRGRPRGRGGGRGGRGGGRRGGRNDVKDSGRASWKDRREQRKEGGPHGPPRASGISRRNEERAGHTKLILTGYPKTLERRDIDGFLYSAKLPGLVIDKAEVEFSDLQTIFTCNMPTEMIEKLDGIEIRPGQKVQLRRIQGTGHGTMKKPLSAAAIDRLAETMKKGWNNNEKSLNLSNLRKTLVQDEPALSSYFSWSNKSFCEEIGTLIQNHVKQVEVLDFSSNDIDSLTNFALIVNKAPNLKKLALNNNPIKKSSELNYLSTAIIKDKLAHLDVTGTPLIDAKTSTSRVSKQVNTLLLCGFVTQLFPNLETLCNVKVEPVISFNLPKAPNAAYLETKLPYKDNYFEDEELKSTVVNWLKKYLELFDGPDPEKSREQLERVYRNESCFSVSLPNGILKDQMGGKLLEINRNLLDGSQAITAADLDGSPRAVSDHVSTGKFDIISTLKHFPPTQHHLKGLDVCVIGPKVGGQAQLVQVVARGSVMLTVDNKQHNCDFHRVFVLALPGTISINDQLTLIPSVPVTASSHQPAGSSSSSSSSAGMPSQAGPPQNLSPEQVAKVKQFANAGKCSPEIALKFLRQANWDFNAAAALFKQEQAKAAASIL